MIRSCYIVDDEQHGIEILTDFVNQTPGLKLVGADTNPLEALNKISNNEIKADITFLDIDMPKISGLNLSKLIKDKTEVVFVTGFKDYAHQAFDFNAIDFLLKPVTYERFLQTLDKIYAKTNISSIVENKFLFIQVNNKKKYIKINTDEITYIEGLSNYVRIHFVSGKVHTIYTSLKVILEKLPQNLFVRSHKSFIINLKFVEVIGGDEVIIQGNHVVPIGASFRNDLMHNL
ncbi:response regulator [Mucilaginibacter sp. HC2]|uniref:LytR/AlgR family response regulator transcription factor n=1 Tax=Mucilaginibacter inviolabilis TaxID=2714892 RepID=UPI00140D54BF|nr:response regulator [Mucilaginibacter inviolabilis]NHA02814.1 response regulator [Mucilaginibacter inviolabilis]